MREQFEDGQQTLKRCLSCHFAKTIHRYNASTLKWECTACEKKEQLRKDLEENQERFKEELAKRQLEFMKRLEDQRFKKQQD